LNSGVLWDIVPKRVFLDSYLFISLRGVRYGSEVSFIHKWSNFRNKGMLYGDTKENRQVREPHKLIIKAPYSCGLNRSSDETFVMSVERRV